MVEVGSTDVTAHPGRLHRFVGAWQALLLQFDPREPLAILPRARATLEALPETLCVADRLIVRELVVSLVVRSAPSEASGRILLLHHRSVIAARHGWPWRQDLLDLVERCRAGAPVSPPGGGISQNPTSAEVGPTTVRVSDAIRDLLGL